MGNNIVEDRSQRQQHVHVNLSPQFTLYVAIPLAIAAACLMWFFWQLVQWVIGDGWKHHAPAIVIVGIALFLLIFAVPIGKIKFALDRHGQAMKTMDAQRGILEAQKQALMLNAVRGFNTEVSNNITGDVINVINPESLKPASRTTNNYLEAPSEGEGEEEEIEQPTVEEIIAVIPRNSYQIGMGRSLSTGDLLLVGLLKKHIKLIGASQRGKSSMAGALMRVMTETHDPEYLQIALLDLENQTCHLFELLPHVAEHNGMPLIARSHEEVVDKLGSLIEILNYRYTLTKKQVRQLPLIVVYLEELIALKDYFKSRMNAKIDGAKEDYSSLVFCIKEIARRGLKIRMQLLACAQCDYRDEDLVEAWINIKNGLSFSVKPTAAQAAGFMQYDLLMENAADDIPGQFVCEMSEVNDLGLAPYFDLEQLLVEWEEEQERIEELTEGHVVEYQRPYLIANNGGSVNFQETTIFEDDSANQRRVAENWEVVFSSRRRHTKFNCDWSSDVCSSD